MYAAGLRGAAAAGAAACGSSGHTLLAPPRGCRSVVWRAAARRPVSHKRAESLWSGRKPAAKPAQSTAGRSRGGGSSPQRGPRGTQTSEARDRAPTVAVIGGGLSGLACSLALMRKGIRTTVFDTGKRGPGGRASSRVLAGPDGRHLVDHAVQAFTVDIPEVRTLVHEMEAAGAVRQWQGSVGTISPRGDFRPRDEGTEGPLWIGSRPAGMGAMAKWLARGQDLKQDVWVARLKQEDDGWALLNTKRRPVTRQNYSYVVMAHNGKCADRLIKTAPMQTAAHAPLRCKFTSKASPKNDRLELSSLWVCVVAVPKGVAAFDGAFVERHDVLSWVGNNGAKYAGEVQQDLEAWTLISTPGYGSANKCSQEFIPEPVREKVSAEMRAAFGALAGAADAASWNVLHLQLWGAALPLNVCGQHFVHDPVANVGVCGDWLTSPSVEGALFSGMALAGAIEQHLKGARQAPAAQAPKALPFLAFGGHAIGAFGGDGVKELSLEGVREQAATRAGAQSGGVPSAARRSQVTAGAAA